MDIKVYWNKQQKKIETALQKAIPRESVKPGTIHRAMRYSLFAGGKRLRPILVLAAAEACGGRPDRALPLACAVECIHTYSLIHDDLPCMDDDDMRRGMPTSHKVFGEGMAVLAGDALLTQAFELTATFPGTRRYSPAAFVLDLARSSGSLGLIAGQVADLEGEGKKIDPAQLKFIHMNKTAALIACSIRLGAMSANATPAQLRSLDVFGRSLGLAFQIIDDILDITATSEELGKSAGKDLASQKSTYPALLGLDKAKREAARLTRLAMGRLDDFGRKGDALRAISSFMLERRS